MYPGSLEACLRQASPGIFYAIQKKRKNSQKSFRQRSECHTFWSCWIQYNLWAEAVWPKLWYYLTSICLPQWGQAKITSFSLKIRICTLACSPQWGHLIHRLERKNDKFNRIKEITKDKKGGTPISRNIQYPRNAAAHNILIIDIFDCKIKISPSWFCIFVHYKLCILIDININPFYKL